MTATLERLRELRRQRNEDSSSKAGQCPGRRRSDTYPSTKDWPDEWRAEWRERAAIREVDGLQNRTVAEAEAYWEVLPRMAGACEAS